MLQASLWPLNIAGFEESSGINYRGHRIWTFCQVTRFCQVYHRNSLRGRIEESNPEPAPVLGSLTFIYIEILEPAFYREPSTLAHKKHRLFSHGPATFVELERHRGTAVTDGFFL